ncbi:MAG: SDR family NAD(P)-dependent oxidoreductase [Terriglobia bacterium]
MNKPKRPDSNLPFPEIAGQVAIVTGAAGGIGSAISRTLLEAGAQVALAGRDMQALRKMAVALSDDRERTMAVRADVRSETQIRRMANAVIERFGKIDILVNNAGARGPTIPVTELSLTDWQDVFDTNLTGAFLCARECLRHMAERREGKIINIASVVAHMAYPLRASYSASKSGMVNLTLTLAQEMGPFNIRVNAILPGPVEVPALEKVIVARAKTLGVSLEEARRRFMRPSALGRLVTPQEIGSLVLFLSSEDARNITGQAIDIGGYGLYPG